MKKFLFITTLLVITNVCIPQNYNVQLHRSHILENEIRIDANIKTLNINFNPNENKYVEIIVNDIDFIRVDIKPYKVIDGYNYYNLYHDNDNVHRHIKKKRVFEVIVNKDLTTLAFTNNIKKFNIKFRFYDDNYLNINL